MRRSISASSSSRSSSDDEHTPIVMQDKDTKTHRHRKIRHRKISNTTIPHHARGKTHRTSTPQDTQDKTQRRTNSTLKSTAQANYYAAGFAVR